jgi:hypothetical protein
LEKGLEIELSGDWILFEKREGHGFIICAMLKRERETQ